MSGKTAPKRVKKPGEFAPHQNKNRRAVACSHRKENRGLHLQTAVKNAGMMVWGIEDRQTDDLKEEVKKIADAYVHDYDEAKEKLRISYLKETDTV